MIENPFQNPDSSICQGNGGFPDSVGECRLQFPIKIGVVKAVMRPVGKLGAFDDGEVAPAAASKLYILKNVSVYPGWCKPKHVFSETPGETRQGGVTSSCSLLIGFPFLNQTRWSRGHEKRSFFSW